MRSGELVRYLDDYLLTSDFVDYPGAYNGLQVKGKEEISRIALCVDACKFTISAAIEQKADLMIVHHGLFWGWKPPITGVQYDRLAPLIKSDTALYSSHLPLDAHPEVGNNAVLARTLGLTIVAEFFLHEGRNIGVLCDVDLDRNEFIQRVSQWLGYAPYTANCGPERLKRIGIVTGGAGSSITVATDAGCDLFLTGEGPHYSYFDAEEQGINVVYAGHYATETVGVKALGKHLEDQFGLETFFIDHPTGL